MREKRERKRKRSIHQECEDCALFKEMEECETGCKLVETGLTKAAKKEQD